MLHYLLGFIPGLLIGGAVVWLWIRKKSNLAQPDAYFRVIAYEGFDLHEAKNARRLARAGGANAHLWAHGVDRG